MSTITLAKELVKIIKSGDMDYACDYYAGWCKDVQWSRYEATEIIQACKAWAVDPLRFGAQVATPAKADDHITYDNVFGNEE